ncbi:MAG: hypothetical protein MO846_07345 [Candidatus Devosia symbiotica]|nr:hypothetical protein [Candidatus Devosia symbiotica]
MIDSVCARGAHSVNVDVLYGLPCQTLAGIEETIAKVLLLPPDRTALFGYAHAP